MTEDTYQPGKPAERYLTEDQAHMMTGLSVAWFQRMRWKGNGPAFVKIGSSVRYKESTLIKWMDERTYTSTTDSQQRSKRQRVVQEKVEL